jgi:hypothetical protein
MPEGVQWLERLATATEVAIARLREVEDPAHAALLEDLERLHKRLEGQLSR